MKSKASLISPTETHLQKGFEGEKMVVVPRKLINKAVNNSLIINLYITDIGFFPKASHHYRKRAAGCSEYILIYCIEGRGSISVGKKKFEIKPNSFYIIEQNKSHTYFSSSADPWSIYWIHFSGTNSSHIYQNFKSLNAGKPVFIPYHQNKISEFEYILDLFKLGYTDQVFEYSSMLLYKLLGSFIYYSLKSTNGTSAHNDELVKSITEFLNENIQESLTIKDIEEKFNKSASTLFTLFKSKTGYSIMHFYNLIKVQKACELMNLTSLSIKEIGYKLNFQDPLYFSRLFKKFMGVPPSQYKKNI